MTSVDYVLLKERLKDYVMLAKNIGETNGVVPELILALIWQESNGDTLAYRYEHNFKDFDTPLTYSKKLGIPFNTEVAGQQASWGLMQIMGATARSVGFMDKYFTALTIPANGINWATRYLSRLISKYGVRDQAISAYNWGHVERDQNGRFLNQVSYVDPVMKSIPIIDQWIRNG